MQLFSSRIYEYNISVLSHLSDFMKCRSINFLSVFSSFLYVNANMFFFSKHFSSIILIKTNSQKQISTLHLCKKYLKKTILTKPSIFLKSFKILVHKLGKLNNHKELRQMKLLCKLIYYIIKK